jgi:hypothetical protein
VVAVAPAGEQQFVEIQVRNDLAIADQADIAQGAGAG